MTEHPLLNKDVWRKVGNSEEAIDLVIPIVQIFISSNQTELNIFFWKLTAIPPEIGQCTNLQKLYCFNNKLTSLPPEIGLCTNLQKIDCSDNQLDALPTEIGQCINLNSLYINNNEIEYIPRLFRLLKKLIHFNFDKNKIQNIPENIHDGNWKTDCSPLIEWMQENFQPLVKTLLKKV